MLRYDVCDSSNIIQLITAMVDANDPIADPATIIFDWVDFFYCAECEEECRTIEDGKDAE
jgi:hypothetical protein